MNAFLTGFGEGLGQGIVKSAPLIPEIAKEQRISEGNKSYTEFFKKYTPQEQAIAKDLLSNKDKIDAVIEANKQGVDNIAQQANLNPEQKLALKTNLDISLKIVKDLHQNNLLADAVKGLSGTPSVLTAPQNQSSSVGQTEGTTANLPPANGWERTTERIKTQLPNPATDFLNAKFNAPALPGANAEDIKRLEDAKRDLLLLPTEADPELKKRAESLVSTLEDRVNNPNKAASEFEKQRIDIAKELSKRETDIETQRMITKRSAASDASRERAQATHDAAMTALGRYKSDQSSKNKQDLVKTFQLAIKTNNDILNNISKSRKDFAKDPAKQINAISQISPAFVKTIKIPGKHFWNDSTETKVIDEDAIKNLNKQTLDYKDAILKINAGGLIDNIEPSVLISDYSKNNNESSSSDPFDGSIPGLSRRQN